MVTTAGSTLARTDWMSNGATDPPIAGVGGLAGAVVADAAPEPADTAPALAGEATSLSTVLDPRVATATPPPTSPPTTAATTATARSRRNRPAGRAGPATPVVTGAGEAEGAEWPHGGASGPSGATGAGPGPDGSAPASGA